MNFSRIISRLFIFLMISLYVTASPGFSQDFADVIAVPAIGSSQINKSDITSARNDAVKKALSKSIETALFQMIPPENLSSDFRTIDSLLSGDPSAYIRDFKVIGENSSGREYRVIIKANVLKSKLASTTQASGVESTDTFPKVLVLLSEKLNPLDNHAPWWSGDQGKPGICETEAAAILPSKKLVPADHSARQIDETGKSVNIAVLPSNEEALRLAKIYRADFVMTGQVNVSEAANSVSGGLRSFPAKADARIIRVSDGSEIASAAGTSSVLNSDSIAGGQQAAVQATRQITEKLAQAAADEWKINGHKAAAVQSSSMNTIPVTINGQDILGKMIPIRKGMTSIKGMKEVKTLEMNYSNAKLQAYYEGSAQTLVNELAVMHFDNFRMEISASPESGIVINIPEIKAK